jgi:CheY-like chemotaxis protein
MSFEFAATRILVVDDDHSIRQLLCTIIRREGFEVDTACDGRDAISKLNGRDYAVILLDLMMPNVNGFEVIEHLKANPRLLKPVVLVISAYTDQAFRDVDPEIVSGVLRKPFEVADIAGLVRHCVSGFEDQIPQSAGTLAWQKSGGENESLPN